MTETLPLRAAFRIPGATHSFLRRGDVALAMATLGDPSRPTVVLVHGYPDTKEVWRTVAPTLAERFHVVAYDVRGAGDSDKPADVAAYDLKELEADLLAVIDAVAPGRAVHLVGHDWGSIQSWELVTDPAHQHRLLSYTSISGPSLDHVGMLLRSRVRSGSPRDLGKVASQLGRSWYIALLSTPGLPARLWRGPLASRFPAELERNEGLSQAREPLAPTLASDGEHGAKLYARNVGARLRRPRPDARTRVPVQIVVPRRDKFVGEALFEGLERWAPALRRASIDAGHWCVRTHGPQIAAFVASHAEDSATGSRESAA